MSFLKKTDYFFQYYNLSFGGKDAYSTKVGGFITLLTMLVFISYSIYLGAELVFKEKPFDNMTIKVDSLPIDKQFMIPTAYLIQTADGSNFEEDIDQYLSLNSVYRSAVNPNTGTFTDVEFYPLKMRFCNHSDFSPELNQTFYDMSLDEAQCFDSHNVTLGGDFNGNSVKYVNLTVTSCKNKTDYNPGDPKSKQCADPDKIRNFLKRSDLQLALHYESVSYQSSDFSKPITKFIQESDYFIDSKVCKIFYYYVEIFEVITESGVLITSTIKTTNYEFDSVKFDFNLNDPNSSELCLFKILFQSSINTRIQKRSYLQLNDVIAQVGGALNAYLIIFNLFFRVVYKKKMTEKLIRGLYKDYENKTDNNKSLEIKKLMHNCKSFINSLTPRKNKSDGKRQEIDLKISNPKIESVDFLKLNKPNNNIVQNTMLNEFNKSKINEMSKLGEKKVNMNESSELKLVPTNEMFNNLKQEQKYLKFKISNLKKGLFTHFLFEFCSCFLTGHLKATEKNLIRISNFSIGYYDVLNVVKKLYEIDKLKFIIFDKKQLSFFNWISQPINPFESGVSDKNLITEKLKFDKNLNEQKEIINTILKNPDEFINDKISLRLMRFYFNMKESS